MRSLNWKKYVGLGLSIFALFFGTVGLTGCEVEKEGDAEELGEELDETTDELKDEVK